MIYGERFAAFFIDVSEYLEAGQKVSEYERVAKNLEKKIKSCQEKIDDLNNSKKQQSEQYRIYGGSAGGDLKTEYDAKVQLWDTRHQQIMQKMEMMLAEARGKVQEAKNKVIYWKDRQVQEENDIRWRVWGKQENERREKERSEKK